MHIRRHGAALLCAAIAAGLLAGCAKRSSEPLVGVFMPLTGPTADFGLTTKDGIQLAVDEINAAGGINGKPMKLVIEDDRGIPAEARTAVTKLVDQSGVVALLGDVASSNSLAAAPVAQMRKIPMISPSSTNPEVTRAGDNIFRVCFIDPFQGYVMARFAAEHLNAKTAAVLWDNGSDYSTGLAEVFKEEFPKMGGKIVCDVVFRAGDIDFSSQPTKIRATNPDVIYVPGYYTEVALIGRKARELGITVPMMGGDGWTSASLIERAGNSLEGCYHSDHYSADSDEPHVRKFVQSFTKRYGHAPNSLAALGYDAAWILAEAMRRSEDLEPASIRKQIAQTKDYPAVTGKITINPERNAEKSAVVLQIRGKAVHYVTTIEPRK